MNKYVKAVAGRLSNMDYAARAKLLREVIQNMNERADGSKDMQEIAAFLVAQLGGDAEEVVASHGGISAELWEAAQQEMKVSK